jgi:hypothetical protein
MNLICVISCEATFDILTPRCSFVRSYVHSENRKSEVCLPAGSTVSDARIYVP